jgi:hypothetical protein
MISPKRTANNANGRESVALLPGRRLPFHAPQKTFPDAHFFVCYFSVIPFSAPRPGLPIVSRLLDSSEFRDFAVSRFREKIANQFLATLKRFHRNFSESDQKTRSNNENIFLPNPLTSLTLRQSDKIFLAIGPPLLLYSRTATNEHVYRIERSAFRY